MTLTEAAERLNKQYGTTISGDSLKVAANRKTLKAERRSFGWLVEEGEVDRYGRENLGKRGRPRKPKPN